MEYWLSDPEGLLVVPETGVAGCAVLVLSGSSGRVEVDRVRLLAGRGAAALSIRWFGDAGQPPGICEVPLETFVPALDRLASLSDHLAVFGVSKGAEAALLLGCRDARIRAVGALSPSSVVWASVGPGVDGVHRPYRSSWTEGGVPVPFVPYDDAWVLCSVGGQPVYRGLYEQSLRVFATRVGEAMIPVERIAGRVLLTAGGNDLVWPSDWFANQVCARRAAHGLSTEVVTSTLAGHRVPLPGEPASPAGGRRMARGGTAEADAALGLRIWPALLALLNLSQRRKLFGATPPRRSVTSGNRLTSELPPQGGGVEHEHRRCCVVRRGGQLDPFPWSDQMAAASSVKAGTTRSVVGSSTPSS